MKRVLLAGRLLGFASLLLPPAYPEAYPPSAVEFVSDQARIYRSFTLHPSHDAAAGLAGLPVTVTKTKRYTSAPLVTELIWLPSPHDRMANCGQHIRRQVFPKFSYGLEFDVAVLVKKLDIDIRTNYVQGLLNNNIFIYGKLLQSTSMSHTVAVIATGHALPEQKWLSLDHQNGLETDYQHGADSARGDDTETLKELVASWVNIEYNPTLLIRWMTSTIGVVRTMHAVNFTSQRDGGGQSQYWMFGPGFSTYVVASDWELPVLSIYMLTAQVCTYQNIASFFVDIFGRGAGGWDPERTKQVTAQSTSPISVSSARQGNMKKKVLTQPPLLD
ncbi:hypothetical protein DEU56DRAFT_760927 [Suillus clintonianus]|uniref:uncharacterized protein n=1 Tax=Suillus clintonianus TaxID=1904413 RepID=UPI001B869F9E|nr:uncharacterized protein DEU56DRAFT_760927 [Suillus clintonianus]KAG2120023.1 hypothetical protein DEU56DRAFT_760927 [Suillus clintonianus]